MMIGPFTEDNIETMMLIVMVLTIIIFFCMLMKYVCTYRTSTREMVAEQINLSNLRSE